MREIFMPKDFFLCTDFFTISLKRICPEGKTDDQTLITIWKQTNFLAVDSKTLSNLDHKIAQNSRKIMNLKVFSFLWNWPYKRPFNYSFILLSNWWTYSSLHIINKPISGQKNLKYSQPDPQLRSLGSWYSCTTSPNDCPSSSKPVWNSTHGGQLVMLIRADQDVHGLNTV